MGTLLCRTVKERARTEPLTALSRQTYFECSFIISKRPSRHETFKFSSTLASEFGPFGTPFLDGEERRIAAFRVRGCIPSATLCH